MRSILSLLSGLIFGIGLLVSGMANPAKVQNFLDIFGTWDPSLAFVMGGAIAMTMPGYKWVLRRPTPYLADRFQLPTRRDLDTKLLSGAAIFGIGWGLAGFCPGPALTSLSLGQTSTFTFVIAMIAGMWAAKEMTRRGDLKTLQPSP